MNIDRIFETKDQHSNNSNYVLLLATGPRNQQSIGHDVNAWKKYESTIKLIYDSVSKHNLNLIIKRHPDSAETDFSETFCMESLGGTKLRDIGCKQRHMVFSASQQGGFDANVGNNLALKPM